MNYTKVDIGHAETVNSKHIVNGWTAKRSQFAQVVWQLISPPPFKIFFINQLIFNVVSNSLNSFRQINDVGNYLVNILRAKCI